MSAVTTNVVENLNNRQAEPELADRPLYRILVRDLDVAWSIGVFDHEYERVQIVRINLDLKATEMADPNADDYEQVVCYADIAERIRVLAAEGHIKLVETLAHKVALLCLEDVRVQSATVRIEKPEALKNANTVGVEITRDRAYLDAHGL